MQQQLVSSILISLIKDLIENDSSHIIYVAPLTRETNYELFLRLPSSIRASYDAAARNPHVERLSFDNQAPLVKHKLTN